MIYNDLTLPQALFQIALAILECNKRQLLEATDEGEAMCCLNEFMANISNKNHAVGKSYDENMVTANLAIPYEIDVANYCKGKHFCDLLIILAQFC